MSLSSSLKSNAMAMLLTLASCVALFPNVFFMFNWVSSDMPIPYLREAQAMLVACIVSGSIAYNTINKNIKIAYGFALFEMFISICYYWLRLMFNEQGKFEMNFYIIPALAFAFILPWSVKNYASSIKDDDVKEMDYNELSDKDKLVLRNKIEQKQATPLSDSEKEYLKSQVNNSLYQHEYSRHPGDIEYINKMRIQYNELLERYLEVSEKLNNIEQSSSPAFAENAIKVKEAHDKIRSMQGDLNRADSALQNYESEINRLKSELLDTNSKLLEANSKTSFSVEVVEANNTAGSDDEFGR